MFVTTVTVLLTAASAASLDSATTSNTLPNSCNDLSDGLYYLKLIDSDEYPAVAIKCSNGYGVLDYTVDENIKDYFSSWTQWFPRTVGPINDEHINWQEWFLPTQYTTTDVIASDEESSSTTTTTRTTTTSFVISPDCETCDARNGRQLYGDSTTYWMTGTIFGCFWKMKGAHNCDVDYDSDVCYTCSMGLSNSLQFRAISDDEDTSDAYDTTGICPHNVRESNYWVTTEHDSCTAYSEGDEHSQLHLKPSLGIKGKHCVCFKQQQTQWYSHIEPDESSNDKELQENQTPEENAQENGDDEEAEAAAAVEAEEEEETDINTLFEIYQTDFEFGTYRIRKSGTYKIMEDIIFDFNPNEESPQEDGAYWPLASQADDYPGAGSYKDAFFSGFFAGITIEVDNVVLDLNGYTLKMSDYFYYQQRWFTTIELTTQYFLPGQGFGNFGGDPQMASNVEIKNGVLGLTSHHGIHGNYNNNIKITDVTVEHFETHGIQFNGFNNIEMSNVNVGPTSNKVYFTGEYAHMRMLLPRYRQIAEEIELSYENGEIEEDDLYIQFYGRDKATTMREIANELELEMNFAFNYAIKGETISSEDENYDSFVKGVNLFVNEEHGFLPNGGAQYGIFLNTFGASVFTYNLATNFYSTTAKLKNIKISGMKHNMKEYVRMNEPKSVNIMVNPFVAPVSVEELFVDTSDDGLKKPTYKGNIVIDALIASNKFSNSWDFLGAQVTKRDFLDAWAQGADSSLIINPEWQYANIGCNSDVMIHSGKGINGLRLDGVEEITIENIEISNLYDATPLGKTICGDYEDGKEGVNGPFWGGHFRQTTPMQTGFSGNMNQGININAAQSVLIKDVVIDNIVSETGPAFGISIWPACEVTVEGDIKISNINAGITIEEDAFTYSDRPNKAPEACGFRVWYEWDDVTTEITENDVNYDIDTDSIIGHIGCIGSDSIYDHNSEDDFYSVVTRLSSVSYQDQETDEMGGGGGAPDAPNAPGDFDFGGPAPQDFDHDHQRENQFERGDVNIERDGGNGGNGGGGGNSGAAGVSAGGNAGVNAGANVGGPEQKRLSYHSQFASGKESDNVGKNDVGYNAYNGLLLIVSAGLTAVLLLVCACGVKNFTSLKANVYDGYTIIVED